MRVKIENSYANFFFWTSMSKTGKFRLTPLVCNEIFFSPIDSLHKKLRVDFFLTKNQFNLFWHYFRCNSLIFIIQLIIIIVQRMIFHKARIKCGDWFTLRVTSPGSIFESAVYIYMQFSITSDSKNAFFILLASGKSRYCSFL